MLLSFPAWFGYTCINSEQMNVIRKLFVKAHRWDLAINLYSNNELFAKQDQQPFKAM